MPDSSRPQAYTVCECFSCATSTFDHTAHPTRSVYSACCAQVPMSPGGVHEPWWCRTRLRNTPTDGRQQISLSQPPSTQSRRISARCGMHHVVNAQHHSSLTQLLHPLSHVQVLHAKHMHSTCVRLRVCVCRVSVCSMCDMPHV